LTLLSKKMIPAILGGNCCTLSAKKGPSYSSQQARRQLLATSW
jgi:hypothetical protein